MKVKPFDPGPENHYIAKVSNWLFDEIMPKTKPNAFKVLCFIYRKTNGFSKQADRLSFSQIQDGTGIKNRNTTSAAIDQLETAGYITVDREGNMTDGNLYRLNWEYEIEVASTESVLATRHQGNSESVPDNDNIKEGTSTKSVLAAGGASTESVPDDPELVQKSYQASTEIVPELVQKSYTQKNSLNNTLKDSSSRVVDSELEESPMPASSDGGKQRTDDLIKIGQWYQKDIGRLNSRMSQKIKAAYDRLQPPDGETKLDWFDHAFEATTDQGVLNWRYINGCLEQLEKAGGITRYLSQGDTRKSRASPNGHVSPERPPEQQAQLKAFLAKQKQEQPADAS